MDIIITVYEFTILQTSSSAEYFIAVRYVNMCSSTTSMFKLEVKK